MMRVCITAWTATAHHLSEFAFERLYQEQRQVHRSRAKWDAVAEMMLNEHGRIECPVNNAGTTYSNKVYSLTSELLYL